MLLSLTCKISQYLKFFIVLKMSYLITLYRLKSLFLQHQLLTVSPTYFLVMVRAIKAQIRYFFFPPLLYPAPFLTSTQLIHHFLLGLWPKQGF